MTLSPWTSDRTIRIFRIFFVSLGWLGIVIQHIVNILDGDIFGLYRYYSIQSNYFVLIWWVLALLWQGTARYDQIDGKVRSALLTYITITFVVYHFLLSATHNPTGIEGYANIVIHYITPNAFVLDFILTERHRFQWTWPFIFLIYPLAYLAFVLVLGAFTGFYPYYFLNLPELGVAEFSIWVGILLLAFVIFGSIYGGINYLLTRHYSSEEKEP